MRTRLLGPGSATVPVKALVTALLTVLATAVLVTLATGCTAAGTDAAERTARAAVRAASSHDGATLCALLSPATAQALEEQASVPCPAAVRSLDPGQPSAGGPTQVWGRSALVPMGAATVFLIEVDGRWRVRAAGCSLRENRPAECRLGGG